MKRLYLSNEIVKKWKYSFLGLYAPVRSFYFDFCLESKYDFNHHMMYEDDYAGLSKIYCKTFA